MLTDYVQVKTVRLLILLNISGTVLVFVVNTDKKEGVIRYRSIKIRVNILSVK